MNKYAKNETMKLIGKQDIAELAELAPNAPDIINDIMTANGIPDEIVDGDMIGMGIDIILMGIIYGKRIERARRKGGAL